MPNPVDPIAVCRQVLPPGLLHEIQQHLTLQALHVQAMAWQALLNGRQKCSLRLFEVCLWALSGILVVQNSLDMRWAEICHSSARSLKGLIVAFQCAQMLSNDACQEELQQWQGHLHQTSLITAAQGSALFRYWRVCPGRHTSCCTTNAYTSTDLIGQDVAIGRSAESRLSTMCSADNGLPQLGLIGHDNAEKPA